MKGQPPRDCLWLLSLTPGQPSPYPGLLARPALYVYAKRAGVKIRTSKGLLGGNFLVERVR